MTRAVGPAAEGSVGVHLRTLGGGPTCPTKAAIGRFWPLGLRDVVLAQGSLLADWQRRNSAKTLPHCGDQVAASGALRNLERAATPSRHTVSPHEGMHFSDSDIYKVLEAAAWDSIRGLAGAVASFAAEATGLIERAQRQDGYLNSWAQNQRRDLVWKDLRWGHELYCAGHLVQAAVAEARSGWGQSLFRVSRKLVEHLLQTFSLEDGDGRLVGVCGHPLIESALVEWYRLTGDVASLRLAQRQVDLRGRPDVELPATGLLGDQRFPLSYFLHHQPVRKRSRAVGHAVREMYLQAGVVDVACETADEELLSASEAIWDDLFGTKTYVTGGHGSRHRDESIGDAYELPSDRAYAETCAAIASFQWNWRLLLATGRARYADAMEQVFWNTIAGSVSREGTEFFYSNTLHLRSDHEGADEGSPRHRLRWYQCACCPPNLARLLASVQAYLVTRDASGLQLQLPFCGTVATAVPGGTVQLAVQAGHPWEGGTEIKVERCSSDERWELSLRAADRAKRQDLRVAVNGEQLAPAWEGSYVKLTRRWCPGDRVDVSEPMPVQVLRPHFRVDAARGCVALRRGPLVYCLEGEDLSDDDLIEDVTVDDTQPVLPTAEVPRGLDGYVKVALRATGRCLDGRDLALYASEVGCPPASEPKTFTFVPFFARGNRPSSSMRVWVPAASHDDTTLKSGQ